MMVCGTRGTLAVPDPIWDDDSDLHADAEAEREKHREAAEPAEKETQAQALLKLAEEGAQFFHEPDGTGFADARANGHRETWPVRSKSFRLWLTRRFYETRKGAPNSEALQSTLTVLEAKARFDGSELAVHVRIAGAGGKLYVDLGDPTWRAVEIDATGWRIIAEPPVRFRRAKGMLALPEPQRCGDIATLRRFLNVQRDGEFVLGVAWLLAAFRDHGPYPVLVLTGEHGTAKSTFARILRALVDPHTTALRSLPREDRDLFIAANNGLVIAVDNVSTLPDWLSDSFCRLATGGGFSTRELYTDSEETLFDAMRPIILNGIEDFVIRPDLADRSIALSLAVIPDGQRRAEREIWADFERERPKLIGALLDAVACGLREIGGVKLDRLPRMADFAEWAVACEPGLPWPRGTFMTAYDDNRDSMVETTIEADVVATAIRSFMETREKWEGIAAELLAGLNDATSEATRKLKGWPATPRALSGRLRRGAPNLRKVGIGVDFDRDSGRKRDRTIRLSRAPAESAGKPSSASSEPSASPNSPRDGNGLPADGRSDANPRTDYTDRPTVRHNLLNTNGSDDADGSDAEIPACSIDAWPDSASLPGNSSVGAGEEQKRL